MKNVILAQNAGFCYGVKRAVDISLNTKNKYGRKIYTLGPLIHNNDVVKFLKEKGVYPIEYEDIDSLDENDVVIIRSHGVSKNILNDLESKGLIVVDATCPYVKAIHNKVQMYHGLGYQIVIVGDENHPEVIGINGWCDDDAFITKGEKYIPNFSKKVCIVSQTTEKYEIFKNIASKLIDNCSETLVFNTICSATGIRQKSAYELSKKVQVMIVIGGKHSSNTTKLYEICKSNCSRTIHIESAKEIPEEIIFSNNIVNIGVTAGASTPDWIIKEVILKMNNENTQMNEQLKFMEENDVKIYVGKVIKGEIISLTENEAYVNLGYKSDGLLPRNEVTKDENTVLTDIFNIGDVVEAKVINVKNSDGNVVLSKIEIDREKAYVELEDAFKEKRVIKVLIKQVIKGGLLASYKSIRVFIPASHIDLHHVANMEDYLGKELEVVVIEYLVERRKTKIIASRKEILRSEKEKMECETWKSLEKGAVVEGVVRRITNFGAFVEINGVDGLLHISEISWGKVVKVEDELEIGQKINVYILDIDKENKKLSLSIRKLKEDPWTNVDEKYPIGNVVLGKVVRFASFGAFVELEPGIDGLIHISQIAHKRINKPEEVLKIGELVKAKILDVNKENKKISLSIKALEEI
ncbi:hypothetical protein CLTEP_01390 [Clostridium tepidiprofundi DSM 19306]|uniref:4-hydroxy-3-methylbut-2-enyl diphosphate reductase n=1 Tax=Clostridium tepidiprofundi DSM 19306 TaxID=1121338 RepID=A0A151B767_9CLOT|nr:bifunctional 4-hydroxy-3-methylbut-2-enyl diphosphate reductase/30S ribosomal protein S1 [Clostridium tepidiprofundi]KYH35746.1 hypothetical protein CLTEP_01390 [Clostridium tepidiprofundi DSM 19306]